MKTLVEVNKAQQEEAAERWRLILALSKTLNPTQIGEHLGVSRSRACQLIKKARAYFAKDGDKPKSLD